MHPFTLALAVLLVSLPVLAFALALSMRIADERAERARHAHEERKARQAQAKRDATARHLAEAHRVGYWPIGGIHSR